MKPVVLFHFARIPHSHTRTCHAGGRGGVVPDDDVVPEAGQAESVRLLGEDDHGPGRVCRAAEPPLLGRHGEAQHRRFSTNRGFHVGDARLGGVRIFDARVKIQHDAQWSILTRASMF